MQGYFPGVSLIKGLTRLVRALKGRNPRLCGPLNSPSVYAHLTAQIYHYLSL